MGLALVLWLKVWAPMGVLTHAGAGVRSMVRMRGDAGSPPARPVPRHSPPASRRAADHEEGTGAWPCVDGGCMVTSIWDEIFSRQLRGKWLATSSAQLWKAHLGEGYCFVGGRQRARGAWRRLGIYYCLNAAKILIKRSWYSIVTFPLVIHTKFIIKR